MPERGGSPGPEPLYPSELGSELVAFLRTQDVACLMQATNNGTAFVIKVPAAEIRSVGGRVPIHLRHELYQHPTAPVIRTVLTIHDRADSALALETFTNVEQDDQRQDFERLEDQAQIALLFYDEQLRHRLTKIVANTPGQAVRNILSRAERVRRSVPADQYDFDQAKADVVARTNL